MTQRVHLPALDQWVESAPPRQLVVVGPAGSGRTVTLEGVAARVGSLGWSATWIKLSPDDVRDPIRTERGLGVDPHSSMADDGGLLERLVRAWSAHEGGPQLICIDDVDRLLPATIRDVCAASRRTRVHVAMSTGSEGLLLAGLPEAMFVQVTPWSSYDIRAVVRSVAGRRPVPEVLDRITTLAAGNPGVACALTASLSDRQLLGFEQVLPVSYTVPLTTRLTARVPVALRRAALLLACGPGTPPAIVERAGLALGVSPADLDELERSGLAEQRRGGLVLRPPGIGFALEATSTSGERRRVHAALADAGAEQDEWLRLWHRAQAAGEPDAALASRLETVSGQAPYNDGWSMASLLVQRASELSESGGERGRRLALAAEHAWLEGTPARALRLLDEAEDISSDLNLKLRVAYVRGSIELAAGSCRRALDLMSSAVPAALERLPVHESTALLVRACDAAVAVGDVAAVVGLGRRAQSTLGSVDDSLASTRLRLVAGTAKVLADDVGAGLVLVDDAVEACEDRRDQSHSLIGMRGSLIAGDMAAVLRYADQATDRIREAGSRGMMPFVTARRALADVLLGRLRSAVELTLAGIEESDLLGQENARAEHVAVQALAQARAGNRDAAASAAELALRLACDFGLAWPGSIATWAMAELELGAGDPERAVERLTLLWHGTGYERHPLVATLAAPELVEATVRSGQPQEGDRAMQRLLTWARASGNPAAAALVERCTALRSTSAVESEEAFQRALALHHEAERPFDEARTALAYGSWLRRERRTAESRAHLRLAHERFESGGAEAWQSNASQELRASGDSALSRAELPAGTHLTAQELTISSMVADGDSNRQIADKLSLSVRTVEYHLRNVFVKLGVRSRTELAANRHLLTGEGPVR